MKGRTYVLFGSSSVPVKRASGASLRIRTENQHRCPWVRSPRRVGVIRARELGKLAPYLW